jgi:putative ABC transport system permease protein
MVTLAPARLRPTDVLRVGAVGLRTRPLRACLSAVGIAIGIAAMLAVVGISTSSRAELDRTLAALGTNLLTVGPGQTIFGEDAFLPDEAVPMISRIGPVISVSAIGRVNGAKVYRNDRTDRNDSGGIATYAARIDLLDTVGGRIATGRWLNAATARYPAVVLGSRTADRLGIAADGPDVQVHIGGKWFTVIGILRPVPLAPELDTGALIGWDVAKTALDFDGHPSLLYCRARESAVSDVRNVLAATANPRAPNEVKVSRPSDALAAKQAADKAFTGLLVGLGAVALLVGGIGVANTMVISVLERRAEIGLRRSLGATRGQIRTQFFAESLLLSALGGTGGVLLGLAVTAAYAHTQHWPTAVPVWAMLGGIGATLVIGALAGSYPAIRAARLAPTEALATQ